MAFTDSGQYEGIKAAFHGSALTVVAILGAYNVAALRRRRQPHLAVNAAVYVAFVGFEAWNVWRHCR